MSKKNTIEEIERLFGSEGATLNLTSTYIDRRSCTLSYTCKYSESHITSLATWQKGTRCLCVKKYKKNLTFYEKAKELLNKYDTTLVTTFEEYTDVTTPLIFINCVGEEQHISLNNLNVCDKFFIQRQEISELVSNNLKQAEIAEKFDTSQHTISMCLRLWGISNSKGNRFIEIDIPKEVLNQIYWIDKQHPKVIANKYNCSITTVIRNMQKYGVPLRTKSESRQGELNPIYNVGHTLEAKEKMSKAYVNGRKVGFHENKWGNTSKYLSPNQGIVTMRSSWEVATADFLSSLDYTWFYEYKTFKLTDIVSYTPDFYIPTEDLFIEVKGRLNESALKKLDMFRGQGHCILLWDAEELLKRGIITNSGITSLNKKYKNNLHEGLY